MSWVRRVSLFSAVIAAWVLLFSAGSFAHDGESEAIAAHAGRHYPAASDMPSERSDDMGCSTAHGAHCASPAGVVSGPIAATPVNYSAAQFGFPQDVLPRPLTDGPPARPPRA